jgi:hypothetical protein
MARTEGAKDGCLIHDEKSLWPAVEVHEKCSGTEIGAGMARADQCFRYDLVVSNR